MSHPDADLASAFLPVLQQRGAALSQLLRADEARLASRCAAPLAAAGATSSEVGAPLDDVMRLLVIRELVDIVTALRRIQFGGYGVCVACGQPISEARLRVLPAAALCRSCQGRRECDEN